ncbi:MAG: SUMF1/EgtB/PvdO family nonheme iron enzyme [Micropepsaceae bacterium]
MPDVFLSYNREDQAKAKLIARALEGEGFQVWWDTVLRAGETYDEVTEKKLRDAKSVVVLWSSRSVRSKWVRAEATLGDRKSALIPVMIEACDRPIMFELIQTADLTQWSGDTQDPNWRALVDDVRAKVERSAEKLPIASAQPALADTAQSDSIETAYWMSVKDGTDPNDFTSYLHRYPQGHFAELAQRRIDVLKAAAGRNHEPAAAQAQPASTPKPSGGRLVLISLVGLIIASAVGVYFFLPDTPATAPETSAPAPLPEAAVTVPAPAESVAPVSTTEAPAAAAPLPEPAQPQTSAAVSPPETKNFRGCDRCPEMTRLAGGSFTMGSPASERGRRAWEGPQREIQIAPFALSTREVSFDEWDACVADGGCNRYEPSDRGWGRGARPVLMVSWNDAQAYVTWLSSKAGKAYRLPSESEWEYAARGGSTTAYWWGDGFDQSLVSKRQTSATGSLTPNGFGLFDVTGNVAEWTEDCYVNDFTRLAADGKPATSGNCSQRVVRGGSWRDSARELRIASRSRISRSVRDGTIGFRVATAP